MFSKHFMPEMFKAMESVQNLFQPYYTIPTKGHLGVNYELVFTCENKNSS
jgi:hypothetical protein